MTTWAWPRPACPAAATYVEEENYPRPGWFNKLRVSDGNGVFGFMTAREFGEENDTETMKFYSGVEDIDSRDRPGSRGCTWATTASPTAWAW